MGNEQPRRFRVQGTVQGVGFRWFVREEARGLGLRGWVRNEPGGDVLVEVGGAAQAVEALVAILHVGPPASRVVAVLEESAVSTHTGDLPTPFAVSRD